MDNVLILPGSSEVVDRIISAKRRRKKAKVDEAITEQERQEVIADALKIYEKIYGSENVSPDAKLLLEYQEGLARMTEELKLF